MEAVETCPVEDYLINWSKTLPILALIHGSPQTGKSTLFFTLANNLSLIRSDLKEEWDYKKYCARSLDELITLVKDSDNKILGYEEAQKEINVTKWYDKFSELFSELIETQGYKKNIIFLVMPCGLAIPNRHRRMVNLGIEILNRNDENKSVFFMNVCYKHTFWKLDESFIKYGHIGKTYHIYTEEELTKAREYTDWLIKAKEIIMNRIEEKSKELTHPFVFHEKIEIKPVVLKEKNAIKPVIFNK